MTSSTSYTEFLYFVQQIERDLFSVLDPDYLSKKEHRRLERQELRLRAKEHHEENLPRFTIEFEDSDLIPEYEEEPM